MARYLAMEKKFFIRRTLARINNKINVAKINVKIMVSCFLIGRFKFVSQSPYGLDPVTLLTEF